MNTFDFLDLAQAFADLGTIGQEQVAEAAEGDVFSAVENGDIAEGSLPAIEHFWISAEMAGVTGADSVVDDVQSAMARIEAGELV